MTFSNSFEWKRMVLHRRTHTLSLTMSNYPFTHQSFNSTGVFLTQIWQIFNGFKLKQMIKTILFLVRIGMKQCLPKK